MKIKKEYILRQVAGENMVVPIGKETIKNKGVFQLNDPGTKLFKIFQKGCELAEAEQMLVETYGISPEQAKEDTGDFLKLLQQYEMLGE